LRIRGAIAGLLGAVLVVCFALACGKKASPLPPIPHTPQPITNFHVAQRGDHIEITYTLPRATVIGDRLGILDIQTLRDDSMSFDFTKHATKTKTKGAPGEVITETEPLPLPGTLLRYQISTSFEGRLPPPLPMALLVVQPEVCLSGDLKVGLDPSGKGLDLAWTAPSPMPSGVPPPTPVPSPKPILPSNLFGPSPSPSPGGRPGTAPSGSPLSSPGGTASPVGASPAAGQPPSEAPPAPPATPPPTPVPPPPTPIPTPPPVPAPLVVPAPPPLFPTATAPSGTPGYPSPPAGPPSPSGSPGAPGASPLPSGSQGASPAPHPGVSGFYVYRRQPDGIFVRVGSFITVPSYVDTSVATGENWCYVVRTVVSIEPLIESGDSNEVCLESRDVIPPAAPVGLTVLAGPDHTLVITWSPSHEADLAVYKLYRKVGTEPAILIGSIPVGQTTHTDGTVSPGISYQYTLTAVDTSGNESKPSIAAEGKLP
jgi:hypothetical protein